MNLPVDLPGGVFFAIGFYEQFAVSFFDFIYLVGFMGRLKLLQSRLGRILYVAEVCGFWR